MSLNFTNYVRLEIPEGQVKQITRKSDGLVLWKKKYVNQVLCSTESGGNAIYNGGLGYKDGYRVRSGGAESESASGSCTGFIPAKGGDKVRLSGYDVKNATSVNNAINVSNASYTNLGQVSAAWSYGIFEGSVETIANKVLLEKENVYYWIVPDGYDIAYIRVSGHTDKAGSKMIVTVNEEIV